MHSPQAYAPNPSLGVGAGNSGIGAQYLSMSWRRSGPDSELMTAPKMKGI